MHRRAALVAIGELGRMGVRVLRRIAAEIGVEGETVVYDDADSGVSDV